MILERTFIDPELDNRLRLAIAKGSRLIAGLTLDDVDELAGSVAAEANHCDDPKVQRALDAVHDRLAKLETEYTDQDMGGPPRTSGAVSTPGLTSKQGQYLSFIYYYTKIHGAAPAEKDFQRYFGVSPPAVHQMIITLEARGFIERVPGQARSIRLRIPRAALPDLE